MYDFLSGIVTVGNCRPSRRPKESEPDDVDEKFFLENGARLLEDLISSCDGKSNPIRVFSAKELRKATNNYDMRLYLGTGGFRRVYKGTHDDRTIVIKIPITGQVPLKDENFNELVILSQINHRNVLKLLGYCLETRFPLLVYEFVSNKTLFYHLHERDPPSQISWENRLRIATEIADALAYLHIATSKPIIHRDVKSSNILLDEHYTAKLSFFGISVRIPLGETHVESDITGTTRAYLDPECIISHQFTVKSDVYSFGVVLHELLAGSKAFSMMDEESYSLTSHFISAIVENRLSLVFDDNILKEGKTDQLIAFAKLAVRCVKLTSDERPTMKEVVQELRQIKRS